MMFEGRFAGRHAVVTGGASGIGLGTATRLLAEGATVCLWDVNQAAIDAALAALGDGAFGIRLDITDWPAVERAAAEAAGLMGGLDTLVASAGISGPNQPLAEYPVDKWRDVIDVNLSGLFHCNRAVVPYLRRAAYGRIVNIASVAGKEGNPNAAAYSAAKAGLIALTKSLGKETAAHDIAVNVITPAAAKTRILDQVSQAHIDYMLSKIPRGRFVTVEEIAALVTWLASDENSFTTGAVFDISGGRATY